MLLEDNDKFWNNVDKANDCWLWVGNLNYDGYGTFYFKGRGWMAHRLSYEYFYGPIPNGLQIDHLCRIRRCINPEHLEAVTSQENRRRRLVLITHCPHGHEYTEENTYINPRTNGRFCRTCSKERSSIYQQKQRLKQQKIREERKNKGLRFDMYSGEWI